MSKSSQPYDQHHSVDAKGSGVSMSQVMAAGLASAAAAVATSRFGVAGTLIGAALTTMIITGGSAVLRSYLETLGGHVQSIPQKLRTTQVRRNPERDAQEESVSPGEEQTQLLQPTDGSSEKRQGLFGRLRSAWEWFGSLSLRKRSSILVGAAIPAVVAFVIAIGAVTSVELVSGKNVSCLTWGSCDTADGSGGRTSLGSLASGATNDGGSDGVNGGIPGVDSGGGGVDQPPQQNTPQQDSGGFFQFGDDGSSGGNGSSGNEAPPQDQYE